ncbi:adhesion G-protein coupled receptor F3-like [Astyanax mexicanus]|uniref:adhesion G-protein coupled receptor F3-like n=1 Tax=Astyanax mexicanus TaxID=7994 RepID=UPI0020CAAF9D|nr:adhesion G-protein coupled receptor F3-like [Astyanax mexicanus]
MLKELTLDIDSSATVGSLSVTTDCIMQNKIVNCTCNPNSSWSDEVCHNYTECSVRDWCTFTTPNPRAMCLSKNRVLVNGLLTLDEQFPTNQEEFKHKYTTELEKWYSMLGWFDSVSITGLRLGSVIVEFVMSFSEQFNVDALEKITNGLKNNITGANINLTVTGITHISGPKKLVPYNTTTSLTCSTLADLKNPTWFFLTDTNKLKEITNGTEARVVPSSKQSTIYITAATEVWKGTYHCEYKSATLDSIIYKDSLYLDIALLPEILIISYPQFPNCKNQITVNIEVQCIVPNTTEIYTVNWTSFVPVSNNPVSLQNGQIAYKATGKINCTVGESAVCNCSFENRLNQKAYANLTIPIIQEKSVVCKEEDGWPQAKSNFSAIKFCGLTEVGLETRLCLNGKWQYVLSKCVNKVLFNILTEAKNLERGFGTVENDAVSLLTQLKQRTEDTSTKTFPNVNVSVDVLWTLQSASKTQNTLLKMKCFPDFVKSSSNLLNGSLNDSWKNPDGKHTLALTFLFAVEAFVKQTNLTSSEDTDMAKLKQANVQVKIYNTSDPNSQQSDDNSSGLFTNSLSGLYVTTKLLNLASKLPNTLNKTETNPTDVILSVTVTDNNSAENIRMEFQSNRLPNHEMYCVFWNFNTSQWSDEGCKWGGVDNPNICECEHLSAFTILMAKEPIKLLYNEELTYAGLGLSIGSLTLCLVIEFLVWNAVVKSNIAHFRHTVLVNIMVSLLIADCSFLASPTPSSNPSNWCLSLTVMKHFCYLAVFFWMMCLGLGLLHQVIFVFVHLRKKVYLGLCFFLGYVCPLIIVVVTFISHNNGATGSYYSTETCWLMYKGVLKGSIYAFLLPVFVIVFVNMFTMAIVICRILKPTLSEGSSHDEKEVARSIVKTVVLLTPTLGITWILGLFVLMLDLTKQPYAQIVNYAFTFFNSFQGFFILLTGCFGERKVRDALLKRFRPQQSANYKSESSIRVTSTSKRK